MKTNNEEKKQNKILKFLSDFEKYLPAAILIVILVILSFSVFFRFVLRKPLTWTDESAKYLFIWLIYIGAAYAGREEQHITIDLIDMIMPFSVMSYFQLIGRILWIIFCVFFTFISLKYTLVMFDKGATGVAVSGLKLGYVYLALPVGFGLLTFHNILHLPKWKTGFVSTINEEEDTIL